MLGHHRGEDKSDHAIIRQLQKAKRFDKILDEPLTAAEEVLTPYNLSLLRDFITKEVEVILGFDDEVVIGMVMAQLEGLSEGIRKIDPKHLQVQVTGFLAKHADKFVAKLWKILIMTQENGGDLALAMGIKKEPAPSSHKGAPAAIATNKPVIPPVAGGGGDGGDLNVIIAQLRAKVAAGQHQGEKKLAPHLSGESITLKPVKKEENASRGRVRENYAVTSRNHGRSRSRDRE